MIFFSGALIALLTFPGVIFHEIAHRLFCDLARVPVYGVCYFTGGTRCGQVTHGPVPNIWSAFLISVGPLFVNTLLCSLITFSAVVPIFILEVSHPTFVSILLMWVGLSLGMHAFPSNVDIDSFNAFLRNTGVRGAPYRLGKILHWVFIFANAARAVWFDLIYAVLVAFLLPRLVLGLWGSF